MVSGVFALASKLISTVWNTAIAAVAYVGEIAVKALQWGLQKLHQIPSLLREAASTIISSLNRFVAWVASQAQAVLSGLTSFLTQAALSYFNQLNSSFSLAYSDVKSGHSVSGPHANSWWSSLGGSVFQGSTGLATLLEIVLTITAPLTLGTGFIVSLILPLILTAALQALAGNTPLGKAITSVTGLGSAAVLMAWAVANATVPLNQIDQVLFATYTEIGADAAAFALAWLILFGSLAAKAGGVQVQVVGPVAVLVLAAIALLADLVGKSEGSNGKWLDWMGTILGVIGTGTGICVTVVEKDPQLKVLTGIGAGLSAYAALVGFALVY